MLADDETQDFDIFYEGGSAYGSKSTRCERFTIHKTFSDPEITCFLQRPQVDAKISVGHLEQVA